MSGCYSGLRFDGLARMLLIRHGGDYPQACRLAEIGLCMPVSTASCERGFSLKNRIKVKSRTSLLPANLERMKLASGPDIQSYPLGKQWLTGTGRAEGVWHVFISHPKANQNRATQIFNMTSPLTKVNLKNVRKNWLSVVMKIWLNMWMMVNWLYGMNE